MMMIMMREEDDDDYDDDDDNNEEEKEDEQEEDDEDEEEEEEDEYDEYDDDQDEDDDEDDESVTRSATQRQRWLQAFDDERQRVATDRLNGFSVDAMKRPVFTKKMIKRVRVNRQKGYNFSNSSSTVCLQHELHCV